jgi:hypothetical protein
LFLFLCRAEGRHKRKTLSATYLRVAAEFETETHDDDYDDRDDRDNRDNRNEQDGLNA